MQLRRLVPVACVAATLAACEPSVPSSSAPPAPVNYVVFDPATSQIPLPNDLALATAPTGAPTNANEELLQMFAAQQGFPNDQEVPVTIDVQQWTFGGANPVKAAPAATGLDPATLTATTFLLLERKANTAAFLPVAPTEYELGYAKKSDRGTITVRRKVDPATKSRRWTAGSQYVVALRGGTSGAKLVGGGELTAMPAMYLLTRGVDLTDANNGLQGLLPGTREERVTEAAQLEQIRRGYAPLFAAVEAAPPNGFGWGAGASRDIASIQTFQISAANPPQVVYDASAGVVPFPSDLLLDPATGGATVLNNPAFGPAAAGLATLDGFSTTAMLLAQTSAPVVMSTVNKDTVFLYDLSDPAHPLRVKEWAEGAGAGFLAEPFPLGKTVTNTACPGPTNANCFSTAIGLQPATAVPAPAGSGLLSSLPPLKEKTEYAVIITNGVVAASATPAPLQPSTVARILLFQNPLADANGKSLLSGQDDGTAAGLEKMRQGIGAALAALQADKPELTLTKSKVAAAYTFRTQSITGTSLQLAAAPYATPASYVPGSPTAIPLAALQAQTGLSFPAVQEVLTVPIPTLNPIDVVTGALNPDTTKWSATSLSSYVIVPVVGGPAQITCNFSSTLKCAPLVVFNHGLGRSRADVFAIANTLAQTGFVVAAIDAPLHGDRSYCTSNAECACPAGVTCTPKCNLFPAGAQGDSPPGGVCAAPSLPVSSVSGKFFVSANFFRTRDAIRESVLDTSALVLALAPLGSPSNAFAAELAQKGLVIDATRVYWIGQSQGGINGVVNVASNPRLGRAVLNVPGATLVDIFSSSPAFAQSVNDLLARLTPPITPGTPEYLQFLQVAKWVLDPAEPANYARHLLGDANHPTLPDLLQSKPAQTAKQIFAQYAVCDQTIPNQFNLFLFDQIGLAATPATGSGYTAYNVSGASAPACTGATGAEHGFLLSPTPATATGQADAAAYLLNNPAILPPLPTTAIRP